MRPPSTSGFSMVPAFPSWLAASIAVAVLGFALGPARWFIFFGTTEIGFNKVVLICDVLAVLWLGLFVFGLLRYRLRAQWILLCAPFVLLWPIILTFASWICSLSDGCM